MKKLVFSRIKNFLFSVKKRLLHKEKDIMGKLKEVGPWAYDMKVTDKIRTKQITPGVIDPEKMWGHIKSNIPEDLTGQTVLDIGCNCGFFSFEMKKRNAKKVVGIDFKPFIKQAKLLSEIYGIDVDFREMSVYDIDFDLGQFDIVLFFGVLYHLKHPFLAIEKISDITNKLLILETEILKNVKDKDKMLFIEHTYHNDGTNWWIPGKESVRGMLRSSGFKYVMSHDIFDKEYSKGHTEEGMKRQKRAVFYASKDLNDIAYNVFPERIYRNSKDKKRVKKEKK